MKRSKSFLHTRREMPRDAESKGYGYFRQAGMVEPIGAGIFQYTPAGTRVIQNIEQIMREEMDNIGGQEVRMPVVHPADLWRKSGRWDEFGPELLKTRDRKDRELAIAPTHEETITDMAASQVQSYRDLPFMLYQIQTKFRDEPRARGGLIRVREFTMKDGYSFHEDMEDLDTYYPDVKQAYRTIFERCGVRPQVIEADPGVMGGGESHEYMLSADMGEDRMVLCSNCDYARNYEDAEIKKEFPGDKTGPEEVEEVHTPGCETIEEVANFLDVPTYQTAKAVFYEPPAGGPAEQQLVFAIIRGDLEIHEGKLERLLQTGDLTPAKDEQIREVGAVPGFASPRELTRDVFVVADPSIQNAINLVGGANREEYHLKNLNYGRDFEADLVEDIAGARQDDPCPECGASLDVESCIELGHIFKLGTRYSDAMDATFQDRDGNQIPFVMGCYGIGPDRLLAAVTETWHDEKGLIWPPSVAPWDVVVLTVGSGGEELDRKAEDMYESLNEEAGLEVMYDDRDEQSGVKFNDAELLGIPLFVIIGPRGLDQRTLDIQRRLDGDTRQVDLDTDVVEEVKTDLERLRKEMTPKSGR